MGLREAVNGFVDGLRKSPGVPVMGGLTSAPGHPVNISTGLSTPTGAQNAGNQDGLIEVVNTLRAPTHNNVPGSWSREWMGPGRPWTNESFTQDEKESEPRSFQYVPSAFGLAIWSIIRCPLSSLACSIPAAGAALASAPGKAMIYIAK